MFNRKTTPPKLDRLPPQSPEAETGVLACCLLDPAKCVSQVISELKAGGEEFYDLRHQTIFKAITEFFEANEPVTVELLYQKLKDQQKAEQVGGIQYLMTLPEQASSAANLPSYLAILRDKFMLRKMVHTCTEVIGGIYDNEANVDKIIDDAERNVLAVRTLGQKTSELEPKELVLKAISNIEESHQRQGAVDGLSYGFPDLDRMTGGMHKGEYIVIACYPSRGKTSFAMNVAEHVMLNLQKPVGIMELEMRAHQLVSRFLCSHSRVNLRDVNSGVLAEVDFPKLTTAASRIAKAKFRILDESDLSVQQMRAHARSWRMEHHIEFLIVDYIQLLTSTNRRQSDNREQEVAQISKTIKATALELDIPIMAMSQLNDDGKLRESRAIGNDADTVGYLDCEDEDAIEDCEDIPDTLDYKLRIKKQRNGPRGVVKLVFFPGYTRFESRSKVEHIDYDRQSKPKLTNNR